MTVGTYVPVPDTLKSMLLGLPMIISGWLLILPGARKHRSLAVLGGLILTAGMVTIVQAHN